MHRVARVLAPDREGFLEVREALLLRILERVRAPAA